MTLWLAVTLPALLGLFLLALGLRGRRVDDHPLCRRCRFDLIGAYPPRNDADAAAPVCPECGTPLTSARAVRIGHRRRRRLPLVAGVVLLVLAAALGGMLGWARAKGFDWNRIKPDRMLAREITASDPAQSAGQIAEAMRRLGEGRFSAAAANRVIDHALSLQADPGVTWNNVWGDLIETARAGGSLDDERWGRYARQGLLIRVSHPERLEWGDSATLKIEKTTRGPSRRGANTPHVDTVVDGPLADGLPFRTIEPNRAPNLTSMATRGHSSSSQTGPVALEPGDHTISLFATTTAADASGEPIGRWTREIKLPLSVTPPTEGIELTADPSLASAVEAAIRVQPDGLIVAPVMAATDDMYQVRARYPDGTVASLLFGGSGSSSGAPVPSRRLASIRFDITDSPAVLMMQVFAVERMPPERAAEGNGLPRSWSLGLLDAAPGRATVAQATEPVRGLDDLATVDIVLRPTPWSSRPLPPDARVWARPIIIRNVPVTEGDATFGAQP